MAANDIEWLQASANYVNLHVRGRDAEIEPLESGDARLLMQDRNRIPCSRRYRAALR